MADNIRVDERCWHAAKVAAAKLDISIVLLMRLLCEGDAEAIAALQREYREAGE